VENEVESLKLKYALQRALLYQCLHNLKSPLSASSGYIELTQVGLAKDADITRLSKYSSKIEEGFAQVSESIALIQVIFDCNLSLDKNYDVEVDLNWLLSSICSKAELFVKFKNQELKYVTATGVGNLHIKSDLNLLRLLLYNLVANMSRYMVKGSGLKLSVTNELNTIKISFTADSLERSTSEVLQIFMSDEFSNYNLQTKHKDEIYETPRARALKLLNASLFVPQDSDIKNTIVLELQITG